MPRAAVFSIVLALAVGQDANLLCMAWCDPHEAAATGCHHQDGVTSPSLVTGGDGCDTGVLTVATFVREDLRRGGSAQDQHAVIAARFQYAPSSADIRSGHVVWRRAAPEAGPLVTFLRI